MTKELIPLAYKALTQKNFSHSYELEYSGRFKGFNANVTKTWSRITFNLSKNWKEISEEIKIGLIQELLIKILKLKKRNTVNIDLYNNFLKNAHIAIPKTKTHTELAQSFERINLNFFNGIMEKTNFALSSSLRTLGTYHYGSDTITITKHLLEDQELLDYVMYHEMLHKHHKFSSKKCRTIHHSKQFREDERKFPNQKEVEKKLNQFINSKNSFKKSFKNFVFKRFL